jgi:hypothetical protein
MIVLKEFLMKIRYIKKVIEMGVTCTVTNTHRYIDKDRWCHNYDHDVNGCRKFYVMFCNHNENCFSKTDRNESEKNISEI